MIADEGASESEDGENYFVSMTDMMVGVLFIFIIMLMIFALDFRTKTDVQDNAIDVAREVARKLDDLQKDVKAEIASMDRSQETRRKLLTTLKSELRADGMDVQIDEANGVLRLTEDAVRFDASQSILLDRAKLNVDRIARVLEKVIPNYVACQIIGGQNRCRTGLESSIETVFIEGHTDSTGARGGDDRYNWQLSVERSVNTYREIVNFAPSLRALRNTRNEEIISVSGYASTRPIDPNENREAWARNRRIDLRFVMEVDSKQRLKQIINLTDSMKVEIDRLVTASGARK
ncbi:flagellar motor protein MotB [Rhodopseudomonas rhenobacensis]|uniref:Flagellar motor protein MotB n=1 Tax=Rhodopseudomonas rhenobacensis TaxID=87461 RepID=A0A7W7Z0V6_9BRAD|nr:OmpA family protein [Rhodopseudomonas rhenobacensis]MBB5045968.1 flagellar motor protein MotB [Rhodopseudomonas rhenobacensis]